MPVIEGASNFTISGYARLYEIHGNAVINHITDTNELKRFLSIVNLPRAQASQNDYQTRKKSGPCFPGTRQALLREMMDWATKSDESRIYVLSGLAGIGKSTVAYTVATQADELGLLGASFFFARDEADRNSAKSSLQRLHTNSTVRGSAVTTNDPQDQLQALILDPLRSIVQSHARPILVVVDALDECGEDDERGILKGLSQLVRALPSFKVILTIRPQPHLNPFLCSQSGHKIFHLQDIEDKVVDGDIRLYLNHSLSLEAVQEQYPQRQWRASAVRYILDKSASNPATQMQKLLRAFAQCLTPFKDLDQFYTVILRNVVPENCDNDDTVSRYQSVVGAIIFVQRPLPVSTLVHLININIDVVEIRQVLDNLQSVILLGSDDVPRIYHKSFPDYLTDQVRCKDPRLRIYTKICHTHITTRCFEIMDKHLKRNILGLGDPARFMSKEDGLKEGEITEEQLQENIPQQLRYACVYWANHFEFANVEDEALMNGMERFADEHMLYWLEVLSLIEKMDSARRAIPVVLKLLKSTSSDLNQLLSDALCFISSFYEVIKRSALHTYYSALPFTPSDTLLYRRYIKEAAEHNICVIEGGPEKWGALVANMNHGEPVDIIKFSLDSTLFVSCSQRKSKIWDAATDIPISTIRGHTFAVANDFSTVASSEDKTITLYDVNAGSTRGTMFTTSKIQKLALSSESSRVAAALSDGTVWLWDSRNAKLIDKFVGFAFDGYRSWLQFSPTGTRLASLSANGIKLRNGTSGRFIANLRCGLWNKFEFSGDGSRIASVSPHRSLALWNSENGGLVGVVTDVDQHGLAISANGSLLATADCSKVMLWRGNNDSLALVEFLGVDMPRSMAFSLDKLAIATNSVIKLYDVKTHSFIHTLPVGGSPTALALSPDCTRLAVADYNANVNLCDIRGVDTADSSPSSEEHPTEEEGTTVTALALSRDCSRLACGFEDGIIELWETSPTKRRIRPLRSKMAAIFFRIFGQSRRTKLVRALEFSPDGRLFASGSDDGTIKLWNGGDGALRGTLKAPGRLQVVALSNSLLVAAWNGGVTLWSLDTLSPIHTFNDADKVSKVSIAENSTLIAVCLRDRRVALLDVANRTTIATFDVPYDIHTMTFLPNNSQLVVQSDEGVFLSLNLINEQIIKGPTLDHLIQLPNTSFWHGVPIWHCQDKDSEQHYFAALFPQQKSPVPVLWIPTQIPVTTWTQGSSMIALSCRDGRIILLRLPTSHVS
ncbi:hypothetical protein M378DRAFT_17705 [Amanita muscaria Koide BX008]|uniref:NACHT domain-containing protein n=1 Tax=Amanita muscaria (strain Koide BX008) TaxID=946122 RepID=A0A0C2WGF1_AMAMK|nr:hypothetical protein M378DRAFT_17705 [Amanita muscaria Koide BX008]